MDNKKTDKPSEEEMWAGPSGQRWLGSAIRFEETLRPIGEALVASAKLSPGEQVIDVGCGAGSMSLEMAEKVVPGGSVTGLDISPELVAEATRRAQGSAIKVPVKFVLGDAARVNLPGKADVMVSRFGTMFFTRPYAAFEHLHGMLRTGGRLALACWKPMKENPWMLEMRTVMAAHFELPVIPPRTPGPFAFDDPEYLKDILSKSHFKGIEINPWETEMYVGGKGSDPDSTVEFLIQALSIAQRTIDATAEVQAQVRMELRERVKAFMTLEGVRMPAAVWLATATS